MIPPRWRRIAQERIQILFRLAKEEAAVHPKRSKRYVELATKIGEKYKVRLPKKFKRMHCRRCKAYWMFGKNVTIRLLPKERVVSYRCRECGAAKRHPYVKYGQKRKK